MKRKNLLLFIFANLSLSILASEGESSPKNTVSSQQEPGSPERSSWFDNMLLRKDLFQEKYHNEFQQIIKQQNKDPQITKFKESLGQLVNKEGNLTHLDNPEIAVTAQENEKYVTKIIASLFIMPRVDDATGMHRLNIRQLEETIIARHKLNSDNPSSKKPKVKTRGKTKKQDQSANTFLLGCGAGALIAVTALKVTPMFFKGSKVSAQPKTN